MNPISNAHSKFRPAAFLLAASFAVAPVRSAPDCADRPGGVEFRSIRGRELRAH